ncbi:MAG: CBS domain-containing protein [Myxococcota bacterium]
MQIRDIMTEAPIVAHATTTVGDALLQMRDAQIRHIPVLERGELVGMVSDRDLRTWSLDTLMRLSPEQATARLRHRVGALMTGVPITIEGEAELGEAIDLFLEHRVGALPVTAPDGSLVGILSYLDILRAVREQM